jgi:hypothetical protein
MSAIGIVAASCRRRYTGVVKLVASRAVMCAGPLAQIVAILGRGIRGGTPSHRGAKARVPITSTQPASS